MANKWRIFHRPLNVKLQLAEAIVKTCCVLHNFVRARDGFENSDGLNVELTFESECCTTRPSRLASTLRDQFAEYFVTSAGAVPWQSERI